MISQHSDEQFPGSTEPVERREISVRRAPKFVPFLIAGALLGVLAAAVVAVVGAGSASYDRSTVFGFFAVVLAVPGMLLGGMAALLLDRASVKRTERVVVERVPDEPADGLDQRAAGTTDQPGDDPAEGPELER
ncbi:hypothetical protein [Paenarthrobacter sp. Z7-10]|uniref:hypothetical protein n=1 Tax=Paenarthrobacter sp. Z7-10 TaxID=2787635 RepID=UPI0022A9258A|nr:hypothetical protein [Paenarthrobacter sp. Z7-10]